MIPSFTDNRGNGSALNKLMTNRYPSSAVVMELPCYLKRMSVKAVVEWAPRTARVVFIGHPAVCRGLLGTQYVLPASPSFRLPSLSAVSLFFSGLFVVFLDVAVALRVVILLTLSGVVLAGFVFRLYRVAAVSARLLQSTTVSRGVCGLFFFLSRRKFLSFFSLWEVFSLNFGGVFEGRGAQMFTFGLSGCGVKPQRLRGRRGSHTTARELPTHI